MYRGYGIRRLYQVGGLKGITARSNKKKRRPKKKKKKKKDTSKVMPMIS